MGGLLTGLWLVVATTACSARDVWLGGHETELATAGGAPSEPGPGDCVLAGVGYATGDVASPSGLVTLETLDGNACSQARDCTPGGPPELELRACTGGPCQTWHAYEAHSGNVTLVNQARGECLDASGGNELGAPLVTWPCYASPNQQWRFVCAGSDTWRVIGADSGLPMSTLGGDANTPLRLGPLDGSAQSWRVTLQPLQFTALVAAPGDDGQTWRYSTAQPGDSWPAPVFDDAAWATDRAPFAGGEMVEMEWPWQTSWNSPDIWLRRDVQVTALPESLSLILRHRGPTEVYVNGVEVYAVNRELGGSCLAKVPAEALSTLASGRNILAVRSTHGPDGNYVDVAIGSFARP